MTPSATDWPAIRALFDSVCELPPAAREAAIAAAALGPAALTELRSLLAHADTVLQGAAFLAAPAAMAPAASAAHVGQRLGDWAIVRAVGSGGMGEVFEARRADGQYEGRAAIKLLKRGMDSATVLQRFAQERQALARLVHPHIARLLDAGASAEGLPYFVLEFVDGLPIDKAVLGLALEARLRLFLQLADAVAHAHRNLLVHRDLKPGNVLVTHDGQVKLLDFGIAKALDPGGDSNTTLGAARPFTPNYASPEQVRGEPVSTATDIYSLGVLLYQMLTGIRPTGRHATTAAEAARSVLEDEPTRPSRLSPEQALDPQWLQTRKRLAGDLDNILLKALEKTTERRYASVDALAADVQATLQGRPVSARPASPGYVFAKFVRRNRWAVLAAGLGGLGASTGLAAAVLNERHAAALGVLGLAAGLVLALWQARRAAVARDDAVQQGQQAARARDAAQQQLAGVKHIATELVFRFGDAISQLPGGAKAQEAMLKQTVASLDMTLQDTPDDPELIVLVASALGRLAQIQGNHTFSGTDREGEAQRTVDRALALAGRVWADKCGDWRFASQHLVTLLTQASLLRSQGRPADGVVMLTLAAQRAADSLARPLPDEGRAGVLELRANVLTNLAHFHDHVGRPSLGQPQQALQFYGQAEAEFRALYGNAALLAAMNRATDPGSPPAEEWANHNIGNVFAGRALVQQRLHDDDAMRRDAEAAIALRRDNLRRNPTSAIWRQGLMFDSNTLAVALLRLAEPAAALAAAQEAWDIAAERAREEGPDSISAQQPAVFVPQYGRALAANGRHAEALPVFTLGLQRLQKLQRDNDTPAARQRCAWLQVQMARSLMAVGDNAQAQLLLDSAVPVLTALLEDPQVGRDARLARAEALALGPADAVALARAELQAAVLQPLSAEHRLLLQRLPPG